MAREAYKKQVALLLSVIPEIAKEECFALHGGTAINLFVRDMPRLSVDIDLTYVPIEDRETSLKKIGEALERIKESIEKIIAKVTIQNRKDIGKLIISTLDANIKIEVNLVGRGVLSAPVSMPLCQKAQEQFDVFNEINVVPLSQLYGGKICAALDRQHPRDLFDVKYLLANEGFSEDIKKGFLLALLCSDRPIHEVLVPNLQDQRSAMDNQFTGMTNEPFSYDEYEATRNELVKIVQHSLTKSDKEFLLGVKNLTPDWTIYNFEAFPALKWKLQNLQTLKDRNPEKHEMFYNRLKEKLGL